MGSSGGERLWNYMGGEAAGNTRDLRTEDTGGGSGEGNHGLNFTTGEA